MICHCSSSIHYLVGLIIWLSDYLIGLSDCIIWLNKMIELSDWIMIHWDNQQGICWSDWIPGTIGSIGIGSGAFRRNRKRCSRNISRWRTTSTRKTRLWRRAEVKTRPGRAAPELRGQPEILRLAAITPAGTDHWLWFYNCWRILRTFWVSWSVTGWESITIHWMVFLEKNLLNPINLLPILGE